MIRLFTKNATGVAPDGRWFAGDINALQDAVAAALDLAQTIGTGVLQIGETGLQLLRYGVGEARLTGALRTDGIVRALGGLYAGAFTTTQRDALVLPPYGLVITNTTVNRLQWNAGTPGTPVWQDLGFAAPDTITALEIAPNTITHVEVASANKDGAAGTASMRTLGAGATQALPGNAVGAQAPVAVYSAVRGNGQTYTITAPVAGTYALEFGAAFYNESGQGDSATINNNKDSVGVRYHTVGGGAGPALTIVTLGAGEVVTLTVATGGNLTHCWAKLTRLS